MSIRKYITVKRLGRVLRAESWRSQMPAIGQVVTLRNHWDLAAIHIRLELSTGKVLHRWLVTPQ